jgi:hypothetical protein
MKQTLSPSIRELRQRGMEKLILFPERLILLIDMGRRHLERHILIRHLRNIRKEKDRRKTEDEDSNSEINPLHTLESSNIIRRLSEESIRAQHRPYNGSNCIESLREIDPDLRVSRWTADLKSPNLKSVHFNTGAR